MTDKSITPHIRRRANSQSPLLCYVTDRKAIGQDRFDQCLREALEAGIDLIQLREKSTSTDQLVALSNRVLNLPRRRQKVVINDRLDVALALGFDGVHLSGTSFPLRDVQRMVPGNFWVGVSTHHLAEALMADREGASYIIFGPIFPTPSKLQFGPPQGLTRLREVVEAVSAPVLAIGGITLENYGSCLQNGAAGIAAVSLFQNARSVKSIIEGIKNKRV